MKSHSMLTEVFIITVVYFILKQKMKESLYHMKTGVRGVINIDCVY